MIDDDEEEESDDDDDPYIMTTTIRVHDGINYHHDINYDNMMIMMTDDGDDTHTKVMAAKREM